MPCECHSLFCVKLLLMGGDSVDERILQHMIDSQAEFLMEVTDKTKADIKVRHFLISLTTFPDFLRT